MEKDTHSYLETEARIVAEDAENVAIVVRIPKAMYPQMQVLVP
jgi:hypothetical protein